MKAKYYASFILQTGIEFNQHIYRIDPYPFLFSRDELKHTAHQSIHPNVDKMEIAECSVFRGNIFEVIDDWNIRYFWRKEDAERALEEYKKIIAIEDETVRQNEYDNWCAERQS